MMVSLRVAIAVVILGLVVFRVLDTLYKMGFHRTLYKHLPGPCQLVKGVEHGSEDMQMTSNGLVFITSGLSMATVHGDHPSFNKGNGQIFVFDMNRPKVEVTPLDIKMVKEGSIDLEKMSPHGLSLWEDLEKGIITVLVVNHPYREVDRVERFEYRLSDGRFTHVRSYVDPIFGILNDVVMTGPETFYASNSLHSSTQWKRNVEATLMLSWGGLFYYNGKEFQAVIPSGLLLPNGVAVSNDKKYLYVASSAGPLNVYRIQKDGSLELAKSHHLHTSIDNVIVDKKTGDLWCGAQPIPWQAVQHCSDADIKCSSQVLHIKMNEENITDIIEVLADDGSLISGSSSALEHNKRLLVGTIQRKLLYCDIKIPLQSITP